MNKSKKIQKLLGRFNAEQREKLNRALTLDRDVLTWVHGGNKLDPIEPSPDYPGGDNCTCCSWGAVIA